MRRSFKALTLAGIAVIGLGVMPGIAAAGHDHRGWGRGGHGYGGVSKGHYDGRGHVKKWRKHAHAAPPRHYRRAHGPARHRHKDDDDALWPILAIGAVGLTAAFLATQSYAEPPRTARRVTFVEPPPPAPVPSPAPAQASGPAATCLMTREYQTQVVVGGRYVEAYGQACLQPDGSWYRGPAQPVPY